DRRDGGPLHPVHAGATRRGTALRQSHPAGHPDQGARLRTLLTPGKDTELIGLDLADLADGETLELTRDTEVAAVVLSGVVDVEGLGTAGGRADVFEGAGHTVYAPPGTPLRLQATGGPAQIAIASAPLGDGRPGEARIIGPGDQQVDER